MPDFSGSTIDHINLAVSDVERSREFYEKALGSIGIVLCLAVPPEHSGSRGAMFGFGSEHKPYGAFVLDPDEINVEAVCHGPE